MGDDVGDEGVVVAHNEEEEKEDGLPEAEDRKKDRPKEDMLEEYVLEERRTCWSRT